MTACPEGTACADVEIVNRSGLHTRTSLEIVKLAQQFKSNIRIALDGHSANAKSVLELLTLGAGPGKVVHLDATGPDQGEALKALQQLLTVGLEKS